MNLHDARTEHFTKLYGILHVACELAEKMAGPDGKPKSFRIAEIRELEVMTREAACGAIAMTGTHDGKFEKPTHH